MEGAENPINNVIYDTRKSSFAEESVFIAFKGAVNDGHDYIEEAYNKGIRNFIVSKKIDCSALHSSNVLKVTSSLLALQTLAAHHRKQFDIPVIAITGSNGKTIIKEWLGKALSRKLKVCKSPKSFNSQLGVALSLLQLDSTHDVAIIEAGISKTNEMRFLERMIKPTLGIFTNLGDAHNLGFDNLQQKLEEKLKLFVDADKIIFNSAQEQVRDTIQELFSSKADNWTISKREKQDVEGQKYSTVNARYRNVTLEFNTKFSSREFIENLMHVVACLIHFDFSIKQIMDIIEDFDQIQNRLELREGVNNNLLINDSYSLDMASLQLALEYQDMHSMSLDKVLIISEFDQQTNDEDLYDQLKILIQEKSIAQVFGIGFHTHAQRALQGSDINFISDTTELLTSGILDGLNHKCILIKGARKYRLENVFYKLSKQIHQTVLETNYHALDHNIGVYQSFLNENTRIMAVIKAEAYGSGIDQVARYMEQKKLDYLAVAIIDEAIQIRKAGIKLPIMVFNVQESQIEALWSYNLEPEVYSFQLLKCIINKANELEENINIHLKIDTGMNRLGFSDDDLSALEIEISKQKHLTIKSIFSHLASAENQAHDSFSEEQLARFESKSNQLESVLGYPVLKHILNTAGIVRFNNHQFDMVRIGLGMYGIDETKLIADRLEKAHALRATVLQVKQLQAGESTGYGRSGMVNQATQIAIISIGYADGLMRACGNRKFSMRIRGQMCPTIGNICMDVSMLDVSHVPDIEIGDEVVIFDAEHPIERLAEACETISYEIISRLAPRIKRIYTYQ